jgi:hypothetical protein
MQSMLRSELVLGIGAVIKLHVATALLCTARRVFWLLDFCQVLPWGTTTPTLAPAWCELTSGRKLPGLGSLLSLQLLYLRARKSAGRQHNQLALSERLCWQTTWRLLPRTRHLFFGLHAAQNYAVDILCLHMANEKP